MAHHRCTGCKRESFPRHKYFGGVFCDEDIRKIRGLRTLGRSWLGSMWDRVTVFLGRILYPGSTPKYNDRARERVYHARLKAMEAKARSIPYDPQAGGVGKH